MDSGYNERHTEFRLSISFPISIRQNSIVRIVRITNRMKQAGNNELLLLPYLPHPIRLSEQEQLKNGGLSLISYGNEMQWIHGTTNILRDYFACFTGTIISLRIWLKKTKRTRGKINIAYYTREEAFLSNRN